MAGRTLGRTAENATELVRQYEAATGRLSSQVQTSGGAVFNDQGPVQLDNICHLTINVVSLFQIMSFFDRDVPTRPY